MRQQVAVKTIKTAHAAGKHIATLGVEHVVTVVKLRQGDVVGHLVDGSARGVIVIFMVVADGAAADVDDDVAVVHAWGIRRHVIVRAFDNLLLTVGNLRSILEVIRRAVGQRLRHEVGAYGT